MDLYKLGNKPIKDPRALERLMDELGQHPYLAKQPNGWSDISEDWMSPELLIRSLTNHNLPLDTIEALAWGSNLDWGFNKHPPMSAFFPEVFFQIFGSQDWAYYLLSQII